MTSMVATALMKGRRAEDDIQHSSAKNARES